MASQEQVEQYHQEGYFITGDVVEPRMLEELAAAARRVVARVRSGEVVDDGDGIRPGGPGEEPAFVTGLMAPEFGEPVFAEYLGSEPVARHVQPFLGDEPRLGWVHLCVIAGDYEGAWHRDVGGQDRNATCEQEMALLARHRKHFVKWHLALVEDPCLWIVPGSHRRYRTDEEHRCLVEGGQGELPGGLQIVLKKGQTIFWNGNTIHRGRKPEGMKDRSTLMCALIDHRSEYDEGEKGDQRWFLAGNVRGSLPQRTRRYYDNWRSLAELRMADAAGD